MSATALPLGANKFLEPLRTANGEPRAHVRLRELSTLWFNTGTLCNLTCQTCYIESSPTNDRLTYLEFAEFQRFVDEAAALGTGLRTLGFTGGEPFMNPNIITMLKRGLERGFDVLVLSNGMRPMRRHEAALLALKQYGGERLKVRISLDHHSSSGHETERGRGTWETALDGLRWLAANGFQIAVAGRSTQNEADDTARRMYQAVFGRAGIRLEAFDPAQLVLFPDMDRTRDVAEISERCWSILGRSPDEMMCSSSRMIIQRKGAARATVVACTLLPYDPSFELGTTLGNARQDVFLNHPFCAQFCVLGGASCAASSA